MAMTSAVGDVQTSPADNDKTYRYSLFGLRMQSDIRLPIRAESPELVPNPDVVVMYRGCADEAVITGRVVAASRCHCPTHDGRVVMRVYRDADDAWIWYDEVGFCHVASNGRDIHVYGANSGSLDRGQLGLVVASSVSTFVLHFRGYACLHASAVATPDGAIAFLGPKGQGKTTMAARFVRGDAALVTDDILPLLERADGIHGLPSLPLMKIWGQSAVHGLGIDDDLPNLVPQLDKKLFTLDDRFTFANDPVRLNVIYVLNRYDPSLSHRSDVMIQPMHRRDGVAALISHSSLNGYLLPAEQATLLRRYAAVLSSVPVRTIHFPHGFEHQNAVHERISEDMKAIP